MIFSAPGELPRPDLDGANIGIAHGTTNALLGILVAAVVIFVTGIPLAYYGLFTDECGVTGVARRR